MNWIWAFLTAILCLVTFVWGEARRSEREDERYRKLVGDDASQRTALRMLYAALGYEFPDLWETPEPQPTRWDRLVAWVVARFRGPAPVEPEPVVVEEDADVEEEPPPGYVRYGEYFVPTAPLPLEPDTGPTTEPEMPAVPGPPTEPQAAIGARVEDLSLARALAEIEDRIRGWEKTHA